MLDHDALHDLLWLRAGPRGVLRLSQSQLATELITDRLVIHRVIKRMIADGRIVQIPGASGPAIRSYQITDPAEWRARFVPK